MKRADIGRGLITLKSYKNQRINEREVANKVLKIATVSTIFHNYNKWNLLEQLLKVNRLLELESFLSEINLDYKKIVEDFSNFNDMRESVLDLAEKYGKIQYLSLLKTS